MKRYHSIIALTSCLAIALCTQAQVRSPKNEITRNLEIFNALFKEMQTFYVDSIDTEKAVNTAIAGMLEQLDPYTEYIPEKDQADFATLTSGEYGGVGTGIQQMPEGGVIVGEMFQGMPAQVAGLRSGDRFITIDGDTVTTATVETVSSRLRGQQGTTVRVTVLRPYAEDSVLTFDIPRRKIVRPSVTYSTVMDSGIGYVQLTGFTEKSYDEMREALTPMLKDKSLKGLVLDLRGNPGGLLESAVQIVGLFVPKGTEVLRTRGRGQLDEKIYKTTVVPLSTDIPLAVLIDGGTASSAEIVSGTLQDLDRAVILGERSYGKGLVQTTRTLPYEGLLKVTVAKYYIPSGRLIQAIDYSHRRADGSAGRIPDSLTNEYRTASGRIVRDGGGIQPDVTITYPEINRLTYNIVRGNWPFLYSVKYAAEHPAPEAFEPVSIDDSTYADFKRFIDPEQLHYDRICLTMLSQLREAARIEGYATDSLTEAFDSMEAMLRHPLEHDMDVSRSLIEPYLAREIATRYFYERGDIATALQSDPGLEQATKVLIESGRYKELLKPGTIVGITKE